MPDTASGPRLLLVEDESDFIGCLSQDLDTEGWEITVAENAEQGGEQVTRLPSLTLFFWMYNCPTGVDMRFSGRRGRKGCERRPTWRLGRSTGTEMICPT